MEVAVLLWMLTALGQVNDAGWIVAANKDQMEDDEVIFRVVRPADTAVDGAIGKVVPELHFTCIDRRTRLWVDTKTAVDMDASRRVWIEEEELPPTTMVLRYGEGDPVETLGGVAGVGEVILDDPVTKLWVMKEGGALAAEWSVNGNPVQARWSWDAFLPEFLDPIDALCHWQAHRVFDALDVSNSQRDPAQIEGAWARDLAEKEGVEPTGKHVALARERLRALPSRQLYEGLTELAQAAEVERVEAAQQAKEDKEARLQAEREAKPIETFAGRAWDDSVVDVVGPTSDRRRHFSQHHDLSPEQQTYMEMVPNKALEEQFPEATLFVLVDRERGWRPVEFLIEIPRRHACTPADPDYQAILTLYDERYARVPDEGDGALAVYSDGTTEIRVRCEQALTIRATHQDHLEAFLGVKSPEERAKELEGAL